MACLFKFLTTFLVVGALHTAARAEEITVADRMAQISPSVRERIRPYFQRQRMTYPPDRVALVTVKDEERLKVFAADETGGWKFLMQYKIARISGKPGPKLKEGDEQVPEGVYRVTYLNPMSKYWLSLALNYPNEFDKRKARADKRKKLGGDIMLHGWWFSSGCIAVGNTAAEDLFVLAKDVGLAQLKVIITPTDFRSSEADQKKLPQKPGWVKELYSDLEKELNELGSEGITTEAKLIAYADIAPPAAPRPSTVFGKILRALAEAAETSATETHKLD